MKIKKEKIQEISTFKHKKRFTASIHDPMKMLKMFTKDLYKFPVQTAIQEYINNAKDAHTMVGKDTSSIIITGPTVANQTVSIKDFGPGLSQKEMEEIFASITASNKDKSDEFNGGFGIGSKSWFAVNNSFTVISTYNKTKSFYNVVFSDKIYIDLDFEQEVDEVNGVEVILPLEKINQIEVAQEAIYRATKYWKAKPKYINCSKIQEMSILFQDKDFTLYYSKDKSDYVEATLGDTIYSIKDFKEYKKWNSKAFKPLKLALHFKVGEGKLKKGQQEVGPDRENFIQDMAPFLQDKFDLVVKKKVPTAIKSFLKKLDNPNDVLIFLKNLKGAGVDSYEMNYKGINLIIEHDRNDFKVKNSLKPIKRPYCDLEDLNYFAFKMDKNNSSKNLIVEIDQKRNRQTTNKLVKNKLECLNLHYGIPVRSLSDSERQFYKEMNIPICKLSEIKYKKIVEKMSPEDEIWVLSSNSEAEYPRRSQGYNPHGYQHQKKKKKIKSLSKDIPLIGTTMDKEIRSIGVPLSSLGLKAYQVANKHVDALEALGYKEFDLENYKTKAKEYLKKEQERKKEERDRKKREKERQAAYRLKKEKEREAELTAKAETPLIASLMQHESFFYFIKKVSGLNPIVWLAYLKEIKTENPQIQAMQKLPFVKDYVHVLKTYEKIKNFPQDKSLEKYLLFLKEEYPLSYQHLTKGIQKDKMKREIEILLNSIPKDVVKQ